ncbi:MAG: hypothetical protein NDF53_03775, partial [archaeon GB-1867-097]|nr:hypothetical protein [Candidatus Culexmicrobium thermophilum]
MTTSETIMLIKLPIGTLVRRLIRFPKRSAAKLMPTPMIVTISHIKNTSNLCSKNLLNAVFTPSTALKSS